MNKKLLLLPILLASTFLSACEYDVKTVYLNEILEIDLNDSADPRIFVKEKRYTDYNLKFHKMFVDRVDKATQIKPTEETLSPTNYFATYIFDTNNHKTFNYFLIDLFSDGLIHTYVSGAGYPNSPKQQDMYYELDETTCNELKEEILNYSQEYDRIFKEEEEKAKEYATIENFFSSLDDNSNCKIYIPEKYNDKGKEKTRYIEAKMGIDDSLVGILSHLGYQELPDDATFKSWQPMMVISKDNNWRLEIEDNKPYAYMSYRYNNTITDVYLESYYYLNEEKYIEFNHLIYDHVK